MVIETERLELIPLTPEQLESWTGDMPGLERELNCSYQAEPMDGMFREIVIGQFQAARRD